MAKALGVFVLAILIPLALITSALAASVEEFYRGKQFNSSSVAPRVEAMIRTPGLSRAISPNTFQVNPPLSSKTCLEPLC